MKNNKILTILISLLLLTIMATVGYFIYRDILKERRTFEIQKQELTQKCEAEYNDRVSAIEKNSYAESTELGKILNRNSDLGNAKIQLDSCKKKLEELK